MIPHQPTSVSAAPRDTLEAFTERVEPELGGRRPPFIAADLSDAGPYCCDGPVLCASILLQSARDLHILNRHTHHVQGMRGGSWFDTDHTAVYHSDSSAPDWIISPGCHEIRYLLRCNAWSLPELAGPTDYMLSC